MALVTTILGEMDESLLERTDITINSIYEYTTVVEYRLLNEPNSDPIHRCPHVTLKHISVSVEATNVPVSSDMLLMNGQDLADLEQASLMAFTASMVANKVLAIASDAVVTANEKLTITSNLVASNTDEVLKDKLDAENTEAFSEAVTAKENLTVASDAVIKANEDLALISEKLQQAYTVIASSN